MKAEEKRFNEAFLPIFDNDILLKDIPNLIKIRDSFEPKTLTKYLMNLESDKRKDIFNSVFKCLVLEYIDSKNIVPQEIPGYPGLVGKVDTMVIAKLKSNGNKTRYLAIGDNENMFKKDYVAPDHEITIVGYEKHPFIGSLFNAYVEYGSWNNIDYYFFNCLNLEKGTKWKHEEEEFEYEFDTLDFDFRKDQKFKKSNLKDFKGNDLYDQDIIWIKFNDTHRYKAIFGYESKSGRCLVSRPEEGVMSDIAQGNIMNTIVELEKVK